MISFQPTQEQELIQQTVREFALSRLRERAHEADERGEIPTSALRAARELALVPANIPEQYGGFGDSYSTVTGVLVAEALAYGDVSMALHLLSPAGVAAALLKSGTEQQKDAWLPRFAEERYFASIALIEPRWDFDPLTLQTVAQRDGDTYVISGTKSVVPMAPAHVNEHDLLVFAHDAEQGSPQAFFVGARREGVTIGDRERGMGLRALEYHRVTLDEVVVPVGVKLGGEEGVDATLFLNHTRVGASALATGLAQATYEYAQAYAKEREAFGKPVAQFQSIAFMLAEMRIAVESMRLLTWEAAWQLDEGMDATKASVVAKQFADEYVLQVADRAVQVLGGHGYIRDYPVERWLRDARAFGVLQGLGAV